MKENTMQAQPYANMDNFYYIASKSELWEKIRAILAEKIRFVAGRKAALYQGYAIIDSQSIKTASAAEERGIDGGKNKMTQTSYSSRYDGKSACIGGSCCQYI